MTLWHSRQPDPEKDKPTPLPARAERKTGRGLSRDERVNTKLIYRLTRTDERKDS